MASNSIGSLFIDIQARTATLESDLGQVKGLLGGLNDSVAAQGNAWGVTTGQIETKLARFGTLMLGARSLVTLLASEFKEVAKNVDEIPGLPADVVESVQELEYNLLQAQHNLQVGIAYVESGFAKLGEGIGVFVGAASVALGDLFTQPLQASKTFFDSINEYYDQKQNLTLDQKAGLKDANFDKDIARTMQEIGDQADRARLKTESLADQIKDLTAQGNDYHMAASDTTNNDSLQRAKDELEADKLLDEADQKRIELNTQLADAQDAVMKSVAKGQMISLPLSSRIEAERNAVARLQYEISQLNIADPTNQDVTIEQKKVDLNKQLAVQQKALNDDMKKNGDLYNQLGTALANDLTQAIFKGGNLRTILEGIATDLLKISIENEITKPLAAMFSGGLSNLAGSLGLGGHAMGGPVSEPSIVGEFGPELFIPPSGGGSITPNEQLAGGGKGATNYYIDASGADAGKIEQLRQQIAATNASVEYRSLAAVASIIRRGGSAARALGQ